MIDEIHIPMKPMSVNRAWQGRRFKSDEYEAYEREMLVRLPAGRFPDPPYRIYYEFGFSRRDSDYDNPVKPTQDILQKKYRFDDKEIYEAHIRKVLVKKGHEYVKVRIEHMYADRKAHSTPFTSLITCTRPAGTSSLQPSRESRNAP